MPRPRVYRHDVRCPECGGHWMPKGGTSKGRQVYRRGECHHYHIPEASYHRPRAADKERALAMYQEGSSLSAVARVFGVSAQAVSRWVKKGSAPRSLGCGGGGDSVPPAPLDANRRR